MRYLAAQRLVRLSRRSASGDAPTDTVPQTTLLEERLEKHESETVGVNDRNSSTHETSPDELVTIKKRVWCREKVTASGNKD